MMMRTRGEDWQRVDRAEAPPLPEGCECRNSVILPLVTTSPDFVKARRGISSIWFLGLDAPYTVTATRLN